MKKINLAITGCMGKMGQQLIKTSKVNKNFKLVSLTENRIINKKIIKDRQRNLMNMVSKKMIKITLICSRNSRELAVNRMKKENT